MNKTSSTKVYGLDKVASDSTSLGVDMKKLGLEKRPDYADQEAWNRYSAARHKKIDKDVDRVVGAGNALWHSAPMGLATGALGDHIIGANKLKRFGGRWTRRILGGLAGAALGYGISRRKNKRTKERMHRLEDDIEEAIRQEHEFETAHPIPAPDLAKRETMNKTSSTKGFGLDKIAASDSTGVQQVKQRRESTYKDYTAEGTGLGSAGGGLAAYKTTKALGPKWNIPATLAGMIAGGVVGRHVGRKGSKTKTKSFEGVIKKQEKRKDAPVKLPSIKRESLQGLLSYNK